jgi:hypothetical protein
MRPAIVQYLVVLRPAIVQYLVVMRGTVVRPLVMFRRLGRAVAGVYVLVLA